MKNVSTSVFVFGIYVVASGLGFLLIPNTALGMFGLPATNEVWIRVLGLVVTVLGLYYVQVSRDNNRAFYTMSIWGRMLVAIGVIVIALLTPNYMPLMMIAAIHVLGAGWTWYASQQHIEFVKA
jgi:hypothetical protein